MPIAFRSGLERARELGRDIDFTEVTTVRKIRTLAVAGLAFIGAVNLALLGWIYPALIDLGSLTTWLWLGSMIPIGVVAAWRGSRCGEWGFLLLNLALLVPIAGFIRDLSTGSGGSVPEVALINCAVLPTLFCNYLRHALIALTATTLTAVGLVTHRLEHGQYIALAINAIVFIILFVFVVVRLLRDLALEALAQARRNEITDPLTGLTNRRGVERFALERWADPSGRSPSTTLLVIDIDHFKQVNDTWGHATGDEVIRKLGALLQASVRKGDLAARLGGEEFLLVVSASVGEAPVIAGRLRAKIEKELYPITASIGGCELIPTVDDEFPDTLWRTVDIADRSLYQAKQAGRNRAVVASAGSGAPGIPATQ